MKQRHLPTIADPELRSLLRKCRDALCGLSKVAANATPTGMGGTPDLFYPEYSDEQIENTDSEDPWDCHEWFVRNEIKLASELVSKLDEILK